MLWSASERGCGGIGAFCRTTGFGFVRALSSTLHLFRRFTGRCSLFHPFRGFCLFHLRSASLPAALLAERPQGAFQRLDRGAVQHAARTFRAEDLPFRRICDEKEHRRVDADLRPACAVRKRNAYRSSIQPGNACRHRHRRACPCARAQRERNARAFRAGTDMRRPSAQAVKSDDAFRFLCVHARIPLLSSNNVYDASPRVCYNHK